MVNMMVKEKENILNFVNNCPTRCDYVLFIIFL